MDRTIVAISTATGTGGIGIVRMSGPQCFNILDKIFKPKNKSANIKGYTIKYGNIYNNDTIVDEVLVSFFIKPNSYTKENMCEINTHGGIIVEKQILELCLKNGASMAEPGEFTKRAFLNGRIDLSQAEAVMDLINANTAREAKESANQLKGILRDRINQINSLILDIITTIDVTIDYPEYDIEEAKNKNISYEINKVKDMLSTLLDSFNSGKIIKNGIKTVILGRPNAGKSSLMNLILNEERAIVSSIEGTTRDTIEEYVSVKGIKLKLIDTAGIHDTDNEVEKIGVNKALKMADEAELIIAIIDITKDLNKEDKKILDILSNKNAIILLNKIDLLKENKELENSLLKYNKKIIKISIKNNNGIENLYDEIVKLFDLGDLNSSNDELIITNERHKNQIFKAINNIDDAIMALNNNVPTDIIAIYLKQALDELGEITGQNMSDEIINQIFKNFCLGK